MEQPTVESKSEDPSIRYAKIYELARQQGVTIVPVEDLVGDFWPEDEEGELNIDFDKFLAMTRHPERFKEIL